MIRVGNRVTNVGRRSPYEAGFWQDRPGVDPARYCIRGPGHESGSARRPARLLVPAFIDSVNAYLRRYGPKLVDKGTDHVRMQAEYDYLYDIELQVTDETYGITVRLADDVVREGKARKIAEHLRAGVQRAFEKRLVQSARVSDLRAR